MNTIEQIREKLADLSPLSISIKDDSDRHAGHPGAAGGGGHYRLEIVSARFSGLNRVARHRLIYGCLGEMMQRDVHALAIDARAPDEVER